MPTDDDDDAFWDFKFSAPSNPATVKPPYCTSLSSTTQNHGDQDDDDDWGDFVNSSATLSHTLSLPKPLQFNNLGNDFAQPGSAPARSVSASWEKPKGALPLSIFGELELEEEGSGVGELKLFSVDKKIEALNDLKPNVSDLIANLCKEENGSKFDSKGSGLNVDDLVKKAEDFVNNRAGSGVGNGNEGFVDDDDEEEEEDGWEFKVAEVKTGTGDENYYEDNQMKTENGPVLNFNHLGSQIITENGSVLNFNGPDSSWNGLSLEGIEMNLNVNGVNSDRKQDDWRTSENSKGYTFGFGGNGHIPVDLFSVSQETSHKSCEPDVRSDINSIPLTEDSIIDAENGFHFSDHGKYDSDENSWAFKDAFSETDTKDKEEPKFAEVSPDGEPEEKKIPTDNHKGALPLSFFGEEEKEGDDRLISQDISTQMPTSIQRDGIKSAVNIPISDLISSLYGQAGQDSSFNHTHNPSENGLGSNNTLTTHNLADVDNDFDDNSWEFKDASSEVHDNVESSRVNIPINDLLSSLYSQSEQNTSFNDAQNRIENGLGSIESAATSNLASVNNSIDDNIWEFKDAVSEVSDVDDFDDDTWQFKDASFVTGAADQSYVIDPDESHAKFSTKTEVEDYVDYFLKLKQELHLVILCHLENLQKARSAAALTGEDTKVQALDKEIQDLDNELYQDGVIYGELHSVKLPLRDICLNEFVDVLREPKFQVFELEYQLSEKLSLVEKNWGSAIELYKYVALTVKILKLLSREEQKRYVLAWSKILNVCVQELKYGASIWKQSLQKKVYDQILSEPQGKMYILALGEIYRVVEVLGSSTRLFKPWILASSADPTEIFTLLSECSTVWSTSGLKEALCSISDLTGFKYDESPKTLLQSIEYIHGLDALALHKHVFSGQDTTCQLSLLTPGTVPGMRTVVWNCEYYFLTMANLWANLVSCDPPNLPHIDVGG